MASSKDKWVRRFIITETKRHKKGFTVYKIISMVSLKFSHEEVSKVSVWKRYNDFKKLHLELSNLHKHAEKHKRLEIKETFPTLPKSKYFDRFEAEVVEERKKYALKFLEFIGRYSHLYSSDIFVTFFETSCMDNYTSDCMHSLNSDTSEDDHVAALNNYICANNTTTQNTFQIPYLSKTSYNILTNPCSTLSNICINESEVSVKKDKSDSTTNLQNINVQTEEQEYKTAKLHIKDTLTKDYNTYIKSKFDKNSVTPNLLRFDNLNNNISKGLSNYTIHPIILHEEVNLSQAQSDSTQYLLIAAAHMSTAFKHESRTEYEEAFIQYKLGISCLNNGIQFDLDNTRVLSVKDKISKYLVRAEKLHNKYLNYNISIINKPVSELQYYKVLKVIKSVMLVMDIRTNCNRIIKTIEKSVHEDNISNYILRKQVLYMVHLYAYIETETTVFLILQYANCGKLWDMIKVYYKASDNLHTHTISYDIHTNKHINKELNSNGNIRRQNEINEDIEINKQENHRHSIDVQSKIYIEVPTMQLVAKSQKLLQSVNATLEKSNSIANRLNESKELKHSENIQISSLNAKTVIQISHESYLTSASVYDNKALNSDNIKIDDIIVAENHPIKIFVENKDLNNINFMSKNSENSEVSTNICASVFENCMIPNSLKNKTSDLSYNDSILKTISIQNVSTNNVVYSCENDMESTSDKKNSLNVNYTINEIQYPHLCKENNMDEEQKLWEIPETVIRSWAAEILLALEALHQQNVLIFDFKPNNILLDDAGHIQLTYIIPQRNIELSKLIHPYSSPESTIFSPTILITSATDIWSFGVILYELLTGIKFSMKHPRLFHSHSIINIPRKLSESAKSLLCGMLKYYPDERLTIDEIKRHPFFIEIDWPSMINSQMHSLHY